MHLAASRALLLVAVTAVPHIATAAPGTSVEVGEDVPIPGGLAALSQALGIDPIDDGRLIAELARLVYSEGKDARAKEGSAYQRLIAYLRSAARSASTAAAETAPIALPRAVWGQAVLGRQVDTADLFEAVLSDRAAALLAYGLAGLDDPTLRYLADHPNLVTALYRHHAAPFAAFAAHLHIADNRLVPPGGDAAIVLWEALLGEKVTLPDRFVTRLFSSHDGRLAYLYDTIGGLDPARRAFALGAWLGDTKHRVARFQVLASAIGGAFDDWDVKDFPFRRPLDDLVSLLYRVEVDATGRPAFPASPSLWTAVLGGSGNEPEPPADHTSSALIDAAWLAERLLRQTPGNRAQRLDQVAFACRVFGAHNPAANTTSDRDLAEVLHAFPEYPMLMLTLERVGVRLPSTYARLTRRAAELSVMESARGRVALAQFQGAIGLVARLASVRTLDPATAETLLASLGDVRVDLDRRALAGVADWLRMKLLPAIGKSGDADAVLREALAGRRSAARPLTWEGQAYDFDLVATEARRLHSIFERQNTLIQSALDAHAASPTASSGEAAAGALADALLLLNYAAYWPSPRGGARFIRDLALRHDFGLNSPRSKTVRRRIAWTLPRRAAHSQPWRVQGSLLGLDAAFAELALRRVASDPPTAAPAISLPERETFVLTLALTNPYALSDAPRDAIADAVARGRKRVEGLIEHPENLPVVAREISIDGWRLRGLQWTLRQNPARIASFFSLTDLLHLGTDRVADFDEWGMAALRLTGCLCTRLMPPGSAAAIVGRHREGLIATTVADLNLRVAIWLSEAGLPAGLARSVLSAAVLELVDSVKPSDPDDWITLVRAAQAVSRERLEDYVALAAVEGPLMERINENPTVARVEREQP